MAGYQPMIDRAALLARDQLLALLLEKCAQSKRQEAQAVVRGQSGGAITYYAEHYGSGSLRLSNSLKPNAPEWLNTERYLRPFYDYRTLLSLEWRAVAPWHPLELLAQAAE